MKFLDWLNTPCSEDEKILNPNGGWYLGIEKVNEKLKHAFDTFGLKVDYSNFNHFFYTIQDNTYVSGGIEVFIHCEYEQFSKRLVGATTFNVLDYGNNKYWGAIAKSLFINNALSIYPQFGSLLNKEELIVATEFKKRKADIIIQKKMDDAQSAGDSKTIEELNKQYDFA